MNCFICKRPINRGTELAKAIMEYQQADGSIKTYGWDRPDGKTPMQGGTTSGRLIRAYHYKHYRVAEKREHRGGDSVTGRGMGNIPTAYEITALTANQDELVLLGITQEEATANSTAALSARVRADRQQSIIDGTGTDNWSVKEKLRAQEKGVTGPGTGYFHRHMFPMDTFQLRPHLIWAHVVTEAEAESILTLPAAELKQFHDEKHAAMELERTLASRAQDPGFKQSELGDSDWRHQEVREIGDLPRVADQPEADIAPEESSGEELSFEELSDKP